MSPSSESPWPDVTIRPHHGLPTLHRDGRPWFGLGAERPYLGDNVALFRTLESVGARFFQSDATCGEDIYHPQLRFWHGPEAYDGAAMDAYFRRVLGDCPDALLLLRVYAGAPEWWVDSHPDDLQVYADGQTRRELQQIAAPRQVPSLASPAWRKDCVGAMRAFVRWLIASGWSKKVGGLLISYGITWEWGILGTDGLPDYSAHAETYFQNYLRGKYGDDAALSRAWGRPAQIADARIPAADARRRPGGEAGRRILPDEQDVIDHQQSLSEMNADHLLALCRAAREESGGRLMLGACYGYTLTAREQTPFTGLFGAGGFLGGHHALRRVARSPDLDFISSPYAYANRRPADGMLFEHGPLGTFRRHGKAVLDENDNYTFINPPGGDARLAALDVGGAADLAESILMLRWAFGLALARGKHLWLTELTGWLNPYRPNFEHPEILAEITRLNRLGENLVARDRSSRPQIVLVLDEGSLAHVTLDHKLFERKVYRAMAPLMRLGCALEVLLLDDFLQTDEPPWKLAAVSGVHDPAALRRLRAYRARFPELSVLASDEPGFYPEPPQIRLAAEQAGVHFYAPAGVCAWENRSMLFVLGETREVTLPAPAGGIEAFSQTPFTTGSEIQLAHPSGHPALYVWDAV